MRASVSLESSSSRQNARFQARMSAYRVSSDVTMPPTISTYISGLPSVAAASNSANLPRKPENGGSPPRFNAGMKYSTAMSGAAFMSPFTLRIDVDPARRSTSPTARNSVVCTTMWWIM